MLKVDPERRKRLHHLGFEAEVCFHCGTCSVLCPLGLGELPRRVFRHVLLGRPPEEVAREVFSCLLCGLCEEFCPQRVPITRNMRILRRILVEHVWKLA
ncbi:4Fe-4S dicluster domain-containing protein [Thermosulfurimonas sp. F29]|uniref:4Fe-4S dicluster domain-containing protein n=1 Tax=Thermosulfurimonas sp. F29 TaxID=2867247 RepID=UPI001C82C4ED|nr:4Fe-4S dicluster domain-containing protein [Thermosulfurimonas sp. F29]MBX6422306.1 4Fe-4S dicluster domain-containing protein [Thermosulfurimonas sp. F29]